MKDRGVSGAEGYNAYRSGLRRSVCPHEEGTNDHAAWHNGYTEAESEIDIHARAQEYSNDERLAALTANPQCLWVDNSGDRPLYSATCDERGNSIWRSRKEDALDDLVERSNQFKQQ